MLLLFRPPSKKSFCLYHYLSSLTWFHTIAIINVSCNDVNPYSDKDKIRFFSQNHVFSLILFTINLHKWNLAPSKNWFLQLITSDTMNVWLTQKLRRKILRRQSLCSVAGDESRFLFLTSVGRSSKGYAYSSLVSLCNSFI